MLRNHFRWRASVAADIHDYSQDVPGGAGFIWSIHIRNSVRTPDQGVASALETGKALCESVGWSEPAKPS